MRRLYFLIASLLIMSLFCGNAMAAEVSAKETVDEAVADATCDSVGEERPGLLCPSGEDAFFPEDVMDEICDQSLDAGDDSGNDEPAELASLIPADGKRPAGFSAEMWKELRLVNKERNKAGVEPLSGFKELQDMAGVRAKEITRLFSHTRPNGENCVTAYPLPGFGIGENIAIGCSDAVGAVDLWMHSPGHKANMLRYDYVHIGVASSGNCYVQGFALPYSDSQEFNAIYVLDKQRIIKKKGKISNLGIVVMVRNSIGYSYIPLEDYMCSGYDPKKEGLYDVTVSIRGCETSFPLVVSSNGKNIMVDDLPEPDTENEGDPIILATGQSLSAVNYAEPDAVKYTITFGKKFISLSSKGKIKGKKVGTAVVTTYVKDGYVLRANKRYVIQVENPKFSTKTIRVAVGDEACVLDYLDGKDDFSNISFSSSSRKIAIVDPETGVVTGIKKGNTKITVLFDNGESKVKRTVKIKVVAK